MEETKLLLKAGMNIIARSGKPLDITNNNNNNNQSYTSRVDVTCFANKQSNKTNLDGIDRSV